MVQDQPVENQTGENQPGEEEGSQPPPEEMVSDQTDETHDQVPIDQAEQQDTNMQDAMQTPVLYTITNNEFTKNKPIVLWAVQSKVFCVL